ncbi:hypothetical protein [Paraburkholderia sp. MM5384-R2]|uniref:hypothetical protein n=1 Tax=Paraburkholderia sp. MM5384-R2 TaxID=2723097 RepID=UPI001617FEAD|nr:hypothetical protein [Paraburkholderia sp. MM5384-R2]MBB5501046.1 hypothetical protein [Paraburkholderia sp. MM5384-R2]
MKNHRYTRIPLLVALSALTVLLAACGNSAPSESDAKTAFQSQIDQCQDLTLTRFKKTNGVPGNDPTAYQVEIEYTLQLEPTSDEKDGMKKWLDLQQQEARLGALETQEIKALDGSPGTDAYTAAYNAIVQKYQPQVDEIRGQANGAINIKNYINSMPNKCRALPYSFWMDFFSNNSDNLRAMVGDGIEKTYTDKLSMVKTDNGWQLDR